MISTIIFDFDGTIADDLDLFVDCYNQAADKLRVAKLDQETLEQIKNQPFSKVIGLFQPRWKLPLMFFLVRRIIKKRAKEITVNEEMIDVIFKLKRKYTIGILSSNSKNLIDNFLKLNRLNIFDFVVGQRRLFNKANALKKILKKRNLTTQEVIYIGDEAKDIEACRQIGLKIISVTWGFNSRQILQKNNSSYLVSKPSQILELIEREKAFSEKQDLKFKSNL